MSLYTVVDHDLLTVESRMLPREGLEVHTLMAEFLLGLIAPKYTGADKTIAEIAVARQINLQVRLTPDMQVLESWENGLRSETFRSIEDIPQIDALAVQLIDALPAEGKVKPLSAKERWKDWQTVQSVRPTLASPGWLPGAGRDIRTL